MCVCVDIERGFMTTSDNQSGDTLPRLFPSSHSWPPERWKGGEGEEGDGNSVTIPQGRGGGGGRWEQWDNTTSVFGVLRV